MFKNKIMDTISPTLVNKKLFPAISIILPVHPQFPDIKIDSEHMIAILKNVEEQLKGKFANQISDNLLQKVKRVISEIPNNHLSKSLLIFISQESERVLSLPFTVKEKVIVDDSFEVRDLIYATQKDKNYLLLIISQNNVKTFIGDLFRIAAVEYPGMPENIHDQWHQHSYPGWDYLDTKAFEEKNLRNYLRFIDEVVEQVMKQNEYPVVVMGDIKLLGYFRQHTRNAKNIIGYVEGNYDHVSLPEIKKKAEPVIEKLIKDEEAKALIKLQGAASTDLYSAGITEVWRAAAEGKGKLLLVEKDYHVQARHGDDAFTIVPDNSNTNPHNILLDAVDDVIELVLSKNGDVVFVDNGELNMYNRIALITRY
jgi:hypothetical protein